MKTRLDELRQFQSDSCKTFGSPVRLLILETIWDQEVSFRDLMEMTGLNKVALSQNTSYMRRKGILRARRAHGSLLLSVANPKILEAFRLMREVVLERIEEEGELLSADSPPPKKMKGDE